MRRAGPAETRPKEDSESDYDSEESSEDAEAEHEAEDEEEAPEAEGDWGASSTSSDGSGEELPPPADAPEVAEFEPDQISTAVFGERRTVRFRRRASAAWGGVSSGCVRLLGRPRRRPKVRSGGRSMCCAGIGSAGPDPGDRRWRHLQPPGPRARPRQLRQ